jgi:membrane protein required for colicin V production
MPFEMLDLILGGIMLLSALLALTRGFTREVLSLVSWGLAAAAGLFAAFNQELVAFALDYVQSDVIARIAVGGGVFLIVLIILSIISVRVADWVLDSAAGPFDRTFGLLYGLVRGLVLVAIAYLFYVWLVPPEKREDWVRDARSLAMIQRTGEFITDFLPPDIKETLRGRIAAAGAPEGSTGEATGGAQQPAAPGAGEEGYVAPDSTVLERLIESTRSGGNQQPQQPPQEEPQQPQGEPQQPQGESQDQPLFGGEQQN